MITKWIAELFLLFQPEDSCGCMDEKYLHSPAWIAIIEKPNVYAKAPLWLLISILTGLVIGQLC